MSRKAKPEDRGNGTYELGGGWGGGGLLPYPSPGARKATKDPAMRRKNSQSKWPANTEGMEGKCDPTL